MTLVGPNGSYTVTKAVGGTELFTMYVCTCSDGSGTILKVARSPEASPTLEREGLLLSDLTQEAASMEPTNPGLGYELCFPKIVDSFPAQTQGKRHAVVVSFSHLCSDVRELVPVGHLRSRERVRVDCKTSAWILGRLLKMLMFFHEQGVLVGKISADNVLIHREHHHVAIFDWTEARQQSSPPGRTLAAAEIKQAAELTIRALGGNTHDGTFLPSDQDVDERYGALLWALAQQTSGTARESHKRFYQTVRSLWPSEKWPFTTIPIEEKEN